LDPGAPDVVPSDAGAFEPGDFDTGTFDDGAFDAGAPDDGALDAGVFDDSPATAGVDDAGAAPGAPAENGPEIVDWEECPASGRAPGCAPAASAYADSRIANPSRAVVHAIRT
jgi:hypothetical protein